MTDDAASKLKPWDKNRRHKHPDDARTPLERWIREFGGPNAVAVALGVHNVTVHSWMRKASVPSLLVALAIVDLSKGQLTCAQIAEDTSPW